MKRKKSRKNSKIAMTLVELVVAMALTSLFAIACIMLVLPVERIYTRTTDVSRAQLLADTIVDSLRAECADAYIEGEGDIWICNSGNITYDATPTELDEGNVLVIRKNQGYCETIYANDVVPVSVYNSFINNPELQNGTVTSRAIFKIFAEDNTPEAEAGYVHFGYFESTGGKNTLVYPTEYYDFTNPFSCGTYREYTVALTFSDIGRDQNNMPSYALCKIDIMKGSELVYSRNTVICFASPVQQ